MYTIVCLLLLATVTRYVAAGAEQPYKKSAPMLCQASEAKSLWKLPRSFNCPAGNHSSYEDVRSQELQLYKQNYVQYKSDAWKCVKITEEMETFSYFFGDENLKRARKYNEPVSSEECVAMKQFKRCGNDQMIFQGGIYQTNNKLDWHYPGGGINCCRWIQFKATNCFVYQSQVYKRHESEEIESAAGDVSACSYNKGRCVLQDQSFLIWTVNNKSFCNVLPWKTIPGKAYGTSWLSDDSNLALTFTRKMQTSDCKGNPLLLSDQGIAVKPKMSKERHKRQMTIDELHSLRKVIGGGGVVSSAQLAASMQALEIKWRQNTNFGFSHALNSVCNFMKSVVELLKTQVLADPTNAIRSLTNQSDIFVRSGGNVIEIYPCRQLLRSQYTLLPMNGSCTAQMPIKFWIANKTSKGYLDPTTNIIHRYATPIDCNLVKQVPLQISGKIFLYHANTGDLVPAHQIPTLKILQWNIEPVVDMKATIFHEIVIYGWSELQTHISLNDIMGGLAKQQEILRKLGITDDEEDVDKSAEKAASSIMHIGYFGFLRGLSLNFFQIWTFCICVYVTICIILLHCCPVAAIPTPLNLPKLFAKVKPYVIQLRARNTEVQEVTQPPEPELFQRFPRLGHHSGNLNRYTTALDLHALSIPALRALPAPNLRSFSASEEYLSESEQQKSNKYPSLQMAAGFADNEPRPFRINAAGRPSETIIDSFIDDLIMVETLIDSGAAITIIPNRIAEKLGKKPRPHKRPVQSVTGHRISIIGEISATIRIGSQEFQGDIVVMGECGHELILGIDFMKKIGNVGLDFNDRILMVNNEKVHMRSTASEKTEIEDRRKIQSASARKKILTRRHSYILQNNDTSFLVTPCWNSRNHRITFHDSIYEFEGIQRVFPRADFLTLPMTARSVIDKNSKLGLAGEINLKHRHLQPNGFYNTDTGTWQVVNGKLKYSPANFLREPDSGNNLTSLDTQVSEDTESNGTQISDVPLQVNALVGSKEMSIDAYLEGMQVRTLLDTGSSLTIVPYNIAIMLCNPIERAQVEAISMTGHQLPLIGEVRTLIRLGHKDIEGKVVVTQRSPYPLIIGTDLLKQFGTMKVDFTNGMVTIGTELVPMTSGNTPAAVMLCQAVKVPAKSALSVMGFCYGLKPDNIRNKTPCCFAPSEKLLTKYDVVSQEAVVIPYEKMVPVTVTNNDNAPKFIPEKASLGTLDVLCDDEINCINVQNPAQDMIVPSSPKRNRQEMETFREEMRVAKDLPRKERNMLCDLIERHEKLFARTEYDLGETHLVEHTIDTGSARPIKQGAYRTPHSLRPYLSDKIQQMMDHGIIQPSKSNWSSPVVMVKKKDSKDMRLCVDNRKLNDVTIKDNYPLKRIEDAFDMLYGAKYFASLDLQSGYWQISVKRSDQCKTAFVTVDGLFEYTKMNFGLCNAPATFQRLMDQVLRGLDLKICMSYIDDIIIPAESIAQLVERLETVFEKLIGAGLKLKLRKCQFGAQELNFLGFIVSSEGLKADPEKISKILNAAAPKNRDELRVFLGFAGWCKRFIEGYANVAEPLTNLLKQAKRYAWGAEAQKAFDLLKVLYSLPPILAYPNMAIPFIICTDASNWAIGAVLCQLDEQNRERPISYDSRVLNTSERNYSTIEKEMLAIFWAVTKKYRVYVYGHDFTVFTDHKPLLGVWKAPPSDGRLGRWCLRMQEYRTNMTLEYREGKSNVVADYLSRLPTMPNTKTQDMVLVTTEHEHDLTTTQDQDTVFGPIIKYLEHNELPQDKNEAEKVSRWAQTYKIVDGVLYKHSQKHNKLVIALPKALREKILTANHDSLLGGHLGIRKTLSKIEKTYYWPSCYRDVMQWCKNCMACQTRKPPSKHVKAPMRPIPVNQVNQKWAWDICGPLPLSRQENKYILVCMEYFTKFPEIFPIPDTKTERLAKIWVEGIVLRYGCPEVLISDQGANVHSTLIQEICKLLDIKKLRTSAYHPQADGMVERFNRTLQHMVSMYVNEGNTDWCEFLPFVTFAYRASVHETTKESPFFLMYGYDPRLPIDTSILPSNNAYVETDDDYKLFVLSGLLKSRKLVSDSIEKSQARQKKQYDKNAEEHTFLEGDRVLVFTPVVKKGRSKKFSRNWRGPYRILQVSTNGTNILIQPIGSKRSNTQKWIHVNRAKMITPQTGAWVIPKTRDTRIAHTQHQESAAQPLERLSDGSVTDNQDQRIAVTHGAKMPSLNKEVCHKCHKRGSAGQWIACDDCMNWYHFRCVRLQEEPATESWKCPRCDQNHEDSTGDSEHSYDTAGESDASVETLEELYVTNKESLTDATNNEPSTSTQRTHAEHDMRE